MKNGKDRNVYDVMNDVNVDIETMDMSDEEKDACVKRLRHKVKARKTGRNHGWKTAAAAVAARPPAAAALLPATAAPFPRPARRTVPFPSVPRAQVREPR